MQTIFDQKKFWFPAKFGCKNCRSKKKLGTQNSYSRFRANQSIWSILRLSYILVSCRVWRRTWRVRSQFLKNIRKHSRIMGFIGIFQWTLGDPEWCNNLLLYFILLNFYLLFFTLICFTFLYFVFFYLLYFTSLH